MSLKSRTLAVFAGPAIPLAAIGLPFVVYLPPYYAGALGLDLAAVGLIFFLVRLFDMPLDPILGHVMDNTRSRFGRFRPWLIAGGLAMMAAAWAVFMAEPGITPFAAFGALMLLYIGLSMTMISHLSWGATLSTDYHDRSRVFGWIQGMAVLAMIVVLALAAFVTRQSGAEAGIHAMGWFVIVLAPLTTLLVAARIREPAETVARREHAGVREIMTLAKNRLMLRLLAVDALAGLAPGVTGAMFFFYFEHRLGFAASEASLLLLLYFGAGLAAAPLWLKLARKVGKHRAAATAGALYVVTHVAIVALPVGSLTAAIIGMILAGLPYAAQNFLIRAICADVADADKLATGLDRAGLFQAVLVTTSKIAHAIPVGIIYPILAAIGFNAKVGAENTEAAINGMTALFILVPAGLMATATWVIARWPHDQAAHDAVREALAARGERVAEGGVA